MPKNHLQPFSLPVQTKFGDPIHQTELEYMFIMTKKEQILNFIDFFNNNNNKHQDRTLPNIKNAKL